MNKKGRYFLFGGIFGFILGLLFAPKKGRELRFNIKDKARDIRENPKDFVNETIVSIKEKVNEFVDTNFDEDEIKITEEEIIISRNFDNKEI